MRPLSLITNEHTANTILESWFVQNVMLPDMPVGLEMEAARLRDGVVVYLEVGKPKADLIGGLVSRGNKVVLYHMGDETGSNFDRTAYQACDLILRNYYIDRIFADPEVSAKTAWVPNGFKSGIGPRRPETLRKATQRRFLSCFLGWLDNANAVGDERTVFKAMAQRHPELIVLNASSGFSAGYRTGLYATVMEYAAFAPCPAGNSAETIRLYDALELGCIPVSLRHGFLSAPAALQDPPFPLLDRWDDFPEFMLRMRSQAASRPESLNELQATCVEWWKNTKIRRAGDIAERLLRLRRS